MQKKNIIKIGFIVVLILFTGTLYSCRDKETANIVLQDKTANQMESVDRTVSENPKVVVTDQKNNNDKNEAGTTGDKLFVEQSEHEKAEDKLLVETSDNTGNIYIHLCGAVKNPDVYEVKTGTRLVDVIKLAGGLSNDAAGDYVNQAAKVEDGQKVYIPTEREVKNQQADILNNSVNPVSDTIISKSNNDSQGEITSGKVNINTAAAEELMNLPGIGESKAESIITYRQEHGGFKTIEEIKSINGIKNSVYNKICDMITVN